MRSLLTSRKQNRVVVLKLPKQNVTQIAAKVVNARAAVKTANADVQMPIVNAHAKNQANARPNAIKSVDVKTAVKTVAKTASVTAQMPIVKARVKNLVNASTLQRAVATKTQAYAPYLQAATANKASDISF